MCVGLSARVVSIKGGSAVIDASGARRTVSAELLDELEPGDYVMVHAGIAIAKFSQSSEEESAQIMEKLDENKSGNN